jgi:M6 family metalloprotease-like protein
MSHPFYGHVFTFTQPDGAQFRIRAWGDQFVARFQSLDGRPVMQNPATGYFEYALVDSNGRATLSGERVVGTSGLESLVEPIADTGGPLPDAPSQRSSLTGKTRWRQRREEALAESLRGLEVPPVRQTVGAFVGLCLPVQFPDVAMAIAQSEIEQFCNAPGYRGYSNNGSVRDYYLANSLGKCDYSTIVAPLYVAKRPRAHYTDPKIRFGLRAQELIQEALAFHLAKGFDFSRLTVDEQNYVYAVNVFYAGEIVNNWSEGLWPHAHFLSKPVDLGSAHMAHDYQITAIGSGLELGTYCHENGHMLCDFPDLYDYDRDSQGVGKFCLMGAGNLADQRNPVQIGAYLKFKAGWADSLAPLAAGVDARVAAGDNRFYVLRKSATEYYLVENRCRIGRDAALPSTGLAIWHVDERGNNSFQEGTPARHYECALIQADGAKDLEHNRNQGDESDLFQNAALGAAQWWDETPVGLALTDISAAAGVMTFKVVGSHLGLRISNFESEKPLT